MRKRARSTLLFNALLLKNQRSHPGMVSFPVGIPPFIIVLVVSMSLVVRFPFRNKWFAEHSIIFFQFTTIKPNAPAQSSISTGCFSLISKVPAIQNGQMKNAEQRAFQ